MKRFLFIILVAVAAVLLWAIRAEAYSNGLVFLLSLVVTALSGYLIADYFLKIEKSTLRDTLHMAQKENQALKERVDLLQTQLTTATPHADIEQFEQRLTLLTDEKNKLDGMSRAQTAEIANLKEKLDTLQKNHAKLLEDATISTETTQAQTLSLQNELNGSKLEIQALKDENTALSQQNTALNEAIAAKTADSSTETLSTGYNTEGGQMRSISDETEDVVTGRDLVITELVEENEGADDATPEYGTSDNLQAIEGIGPKIDAVLKAEGIATWEILSMTTHERLRVVLDNAGKQYTHIDPTSWTEQARLLVHREFSKLKKYKESILGN